MNIIQQKYDDLTFVDIYFVNIFILVVVSLVVLLAIAFLFIMRKRATIADNWAAERCEPQNLLFAGYIHNPNGESIYDYTINNFNYCIQDIVKGATEQSLNPVHYIISSVVVLYGIIAEGINQSRYMMNEMRERVAALVSAIFSQILAMLIPIQTFFISIRDLLNKFVGIIYVFVLTFLDFWLVLQSSTTMILNAIVRILIITAAVIVVLWAGFFTAPAAIATTAIFVAIAIPLGRIVSILGDAMNLNINALPRVPRCFTKDTPVFMNNGKTREIGNIMVGEVLLNGGVVKSVLRLASHGEEIYSLYGIRVSGEHWVIYKQEWMRVREHPDAIKTEALGEDEFLYCMNTENKVIPVRSVIGQVITFADWDEVVVGGDVLHHLMAYDPTLTMKTLNEKMDVGYAASHLVFVKNRVRRAATTSYQFDVNIKPIGQVVIGDILYGGGEVVEGVVRMIKGGRILYNVVLDRRSTHFKDYNYGLDRFILN